MRRNLLVILANLFLFVLAGKAIVRGLKSSRNGWKSNPIRMMAKIIFSFLVGQGVFWLIGYDQLGIFMNPKVKMGLGQPIADKLYERIPHTSMTAWIIKTIETLADAGKIPIEGAVYLKYGFAPDGVAAAVTQPLWSTIETAEKATGAMLHPEKVAEPEQIRNSLGCIYGSFFRYLQAAILWIFGLWIYKLLGEPIELALRKAVATFRQR